MAFGEITVAMSGLFAAQQGLSVTSSNINNINTPGYSRQEIKQEAWNPLPGGGVGMIGTGTTVTGVERVRDPFLDQKIWKYSDMLGEYSIKQEQTAIIENIFGEPKDEGFTKIYTNFFNGLDDLSKDPNTTEKASALRQYMIGFADYYNEMASGLSETQSDINAQLKITVDQINLMASRVQSLNGQIQNYELHGGKIANELRDQRDHCVDQLSQFVNIEAKEVEMHKPDGSVEKQFQVYVNGQTLVDHKDIRLLEVEPRETKKHPRDIDGLYDIVWDDKAVFNTTSEYFSGKLKGLLDVRDGQGAGLDPITHKPVYTGIPYFQDRLDRFVRDFSKELNRIYNQGDIIDANGNREQILDDLGNPVYALFSYRDEDTSAIIASNDPNFDYNKMTAENFSTSLEIIESDKNIRTNYEHRMDVINDPKLDPPYNSEIYYNPNPGNNDLLLDLMDQQNNQDVFSQGTPTDYMISIFSAMGVNASEAQMYAKTQSNIISEIENQRMAVSGVDNNEEFMNLIKYNMAYQISAKVMSTLDNIYDITINRMGSW
ncbi:flagellar hook-associated protein FlgK [Candidatus Epulonipiscium viviparus]|uniref:flagellar hook-associated protein FlgK n=1 Tax=Candidatus Epulonipiscium viviparus TaxID=420336 RepID=UPI00016BFB06|nr:flagellar hook-associated protein FlgK [Candidatus Epulopiscium viviparus]